MNTFSLKLPRLMLLIGAFVSLIACKKEPEVVALDEQPRILTMSLPGIPPENISIDHMAYTITVLLPSTLPALEMIPSFTVSQQAHIHDEWGTGKKAISLAHYCPCTYDEQGKVGQFKPIESVRVDNLLRTSYYTIQLKRNGDPFRIKPLTTPIVYDSKSTYYNIVVPVENYYGASFIEYIAVTPTGSLWPNWLGPGGSCMEFCAGRLNEIGLSLSGYRGGYGETLTFSLKPGLHDLDLRLADGTKVHAEGAILVK